MQSVKALLREPEMKIKKAAWHRHPEDTDILRLRPGELIGASIVNQLSLMSTTWMIAFTHQSLKTSELSNLWKACLFSSCGDRDSACMCSASFSYLSKDEKGSTRHPFQSEASTSPACSQGAVAVAFQTVFKSAASELWELCVEEVDKHDHTNSLKCLHENK